ncbi:Galactinol synthase 2, partial [Linum grandiflorum]
SFHPPFILHTSKTQNSQRSHNSKNRFLDSFLSQLQIQSNHQANQNMAPEIPPTYNNAAAAITAGLTKQPSISKCAYVTFLAGNGDYVKGVVGLAKGLRKVKSKYPLVVAVLPDVPEDHRRILVSQGCIVREIEPVYPPENQTQFAMAYYVINYSKLRIWKFVEYSKMIYLDGDIQVFSNIDHLFDLPDGRLYAVMDCFCEKTWSHTPQYKIGYCQQRPDKVKWASELGPKPSLYFNAGMFVYEPSLSIYDNLLESLKVAPTTPFAEQDFLNSFFKDIYRPIPSNYNLVLAMLWRHPENVQLEKVKVVHYCAAGSKPWRYTGEEENMDREDIKMLVKKWWDVYDDESLDYWNWVAEKEAVTAAPEAVDMQPFLAALSEAGVVHYVTAPSAA